MLYSATTTNPRLQFAKPPMSTITIGCTHCRGDCRPSASEMASAVNANPSSDAIDMKRSIHSQVEGLVGFVPEIRWTRIVKVSVSIAKLARLKMSLIGSCRRIRPRPMAAPRMRASTSSPGSPASMNTPMTRGISLNENDWDSLRKWMKTRHHSPTANPTTSAATIHRIGGPADWRRGATATTYTRAANRHMHMFRTQMGVTLRPLAVGRFSGPALASAARCLVFTKPRGTSHSPVHRDLPREPGAGSGRAPLRG